MDLIQASINGPTEQAVEAMRLLIYVAPVALYLLVLGLVHSQATATLIDARSDFVALTAVFYPLLVLPVPGLVRSGYALPCALAAIALGLLFYRLLPARLAGWVIYNLPASRVPWVLERALRSLGWAHTWDGPNRVIAERGLSIDIASVPVLRNISLHLHREAHGRATADDVADLRREIAARLTASPQLPSVSGCCLMMLGVAMLVLPLWMMSRHSDAIAEAVSRLLLS
jgi:hypothetical protein